MISQKIINNLSNASWIRAMFEEGEKLRKIYGQDKVYDFTLGNPDPEPPSVVKESLKNFILNDADGIHRYMNNAGFLDVREIIAKHLEKETDVPLQAEHILMTCGAAGGLNVALKTILDPDNEVIVFAPYFVEYLFYVDNHGGKTVIVPTNPDTFEPDLNALQNSINKNTKAIIINSPNNPTGAIYSKDTVTRMSHIIKQMEHKYNSTIYIISDEPYNKLVYDNIELPSILKIFDNSIIVNSYSKSHSLPGERIGYIAVNPQIDDLELLINGMIFANRTLGFVNAPALFQKVIAKSLNAKVNIEIYKKRRDILYNYLIQLGFSCVKPNGAFYLFPKALIPDDIEFVKRALKYNLLLVPGKGFGYPGYFRIAYCVSEKTIENSLPAFYSLAKECLNSDS